MQDIPRPVSRAVRLLAGSTLAVGLWLCSATASAQVVLTLDAQREVLSTSDFFVINNEAIADAALEELDEALADYAAGEMGAIQLAADVLDAAEEIAPELAAVDSVVDEDLVLIAADEAIDTGEAADAVETAVRAFFDEVAVSEPVSERVGELLARLATARAALGPGSAEAEASVDEALAALGATPLAPE